MNAQITPKLSWSAYKAANPKVRIRNAAAELGVSELELLSSDLSENCIRLKPDIVAILSALPSLGNVMALTRNDAAVHEVTAPFSEMKMKKQTALFMRPGQDARFFTENWQYAFAVNENDRRSIQFFDTRGVAVHKVYLVEDSNTANYSTLVANFKDDTQVSVQLSEQTEECTQEYADIDGEALRDQWSKMQNVHEGSQMLKALNCHRLTAYEALGNEYAVKLSSDTIEEALQIISETKMKTMIFVHNDHCVQSFAGAAERLMRIGPWFNILDPGFNLHLNTELLSQVWLITKPSKDGFVHSLNAFDINNNETLTMTDNRSRGESESADWSALIESLQQNEAATIT